MKRKRKHTAVKAIRVADFIISFLERIGVRAVFTVSGGGSIFLDDALAINKTVRYYACHHEQAAAMATEAYARVRGDIGVTLVTTGPGATNAITGVAGSWMDSIPHLVLSGQVFLNQTIRNTGTRQIGVQEINIIDIVRPMTKYAVMIEDPARIRYFLEKAVHIARTGRPGPVWLDIPANVQNARIEVASLEGFDPSELPPIKPDRELKAKVRQVVRLLRAARKPLLHVGQGVRIAGALPDFLKLVESHRIPFVTARNANDIVPTDHELYVGRPGTFAQRGANFAVANADVYLAVGTRLTMTQTGYNSRDYARNARRVMVDIDRTELEKDTLEIHLKIHADAKLFLSELNKQLSAVALDTGDWIDRCRQWKRKYPVVLAEYENQKGSVNSYYFIGVLSDLLAPKDVVVTDMGIAFQGTHQAFRVKKGQRLFTNSGFASMGWGLPAAVGACIGHDNRRTICIAGEGGLQMNIQELATIMHHKLPIKLFVYNNGGYMTIKQTQEFAFEGRLMGCNGESGLSFPNLNKIADAHAMKYFKVKDHKRLKEIVRAVLKHSGPVVCEIMMDPDQAQIPKYLPRKKADGSAIPTPLEDLYPYLDEKEFKENMGG